MRHLVASAALGLVAILPAAAEPIVYQGVLDVSGQPANTPHDLAFVVYDAETGGAQIAGPIQLNDVPINDGLFSVELDFPDAAFEGPAWLLIFARDADSDGPMTALNPRQPIRPAPAAIQHRTEPWSGDDTLRTLGAGDTKAFINRSTAITPAEFFGFTAPTPLPGAFGGMYIDTAQPDGKPFYGYATGGDFRVFTYYHHPTQEWRVYNAGEKLTIDALGNVEAITRFVAPEFQYDAPEQRVLLLSPHDFVGTGGWTWFTFVNEGFLNNQGGGGCAEAKLDIPDGATITDMTVIFEDASAPSDLDFDLKRVDPLAGTTDFMASLDPTGSVAGIRTETTSSISLNTIDNTNFYYTIRVCSNAWITNGAFGVRAVRIDYTVPRPD